MKNQTVFFRITMPILLQNDREKIFYDYRHSAKRLFLLDYDGTLVPFARNPADAVPEADVIRILQRTLEDPRNRVAVISGRTRKFLQEYLSFPRLVLMAEHGAYIRPEDGEWYSRTTVQAEMLQTIFVHLRPYLDLCPGAFIEMKESSLVWHYRECSDETGQNIATIIQTAFPRWDIKHMDLMPGNKVIEFKPANIDKGSAVKSCFDFIQYDFILAVGDDFNDESVFQILPLTAYSVKIGKGETFARYRIDHQTETLPWLSALLDQP